VAKIIILTDLTAYPFFCGQIRWTSGDLRIKIE